MPLKEVQNHLMKALYSVHRQLVQVHIITSFAYFIFFLGVGLQIYLQITTFSPNLVTFCLSGTSILAVLWVLLSCLYCNTRTGALHSLLDNLFSRMRPLAMLWLGFLVYVTSVSQVVKDVVTVTDGESKLETHETIDESGFFNQQSASAKSVSSLGPVEASVPRLWDLVNIFLVGSVVVHTVSQLVSSLFARRSGSTASVAVENGGATGRCRKCQSSDEFYLWAGGLLFCLLGLCLAPLNGVHSWLTLTTLNLALWCNISALAKRSFLGVISTSVYLLLVFLCLLPRLRHESLIKFRLHVGHPSLWVLIVYGCHLSLPSLISWLCTTSPPLDQRWRAWIYTAHKRRILVAVAWFLGEIFTCVMCALSLVKHPEWFVVIPLFLAVAFAWLCFHLLTFITVCRLQQRISQCTNSLRTLGEGNEGLLRIMAAKGVRHFGLLSTRIVGFTMASSFLLAVVSWETMTSWSMSLLLLVLPTECLLYSLFLEMGSSLGGTCIGFVIAAPALLKRFSLLQQQSFLSRQHANVLNRSASWQSVVNPGSSRLFSRIFFDKHQNSAPNTSPLYDPMVVAHRPTTNSVTLIPPECVQEAAMRCTQTLALIQRFFAEHMIFEFGCDYSSSGLSTDMVKNKLRSLFQSTTADGPRYDTYLVYYCGQTLPNGDWALGEGHLELEHLLELWLKCCPSTPSPSSRLLLVCDSMNSHAWLRPIRRLRTGCVALQTVVHETRGKPQTSRWFRGMEDEEGGRLAAGGRLDAWDAVNAFTRDWVLWNRRSGSTQRDPYREKEKLLSESSPSSSSQSGSSSAATRKSANKGDIDWRDPQRNVRAAYAVSEQWCDFSFHLPSATDLERHWNDNFPRFTLPFLRAVNLGVTHSQNDHNSPPGGLADVSACLGVLCSCLFCEPVLRWIRHWRMWCLPPLELDTGHGFSLVRSPHT